MTPSEQRAFFEDQGYLVVEGVLSGAELAECRAEIGRLHEMAAELEAKGDPGIRQFQREPYAKGAQQTRGLPVLRKIEQTRDFSEVFRKLASHPKLVAAVQNLIGPDLLLFRSTLMLKPAFHGSAHAFHQDSAYWPMEPPTLVTVSLALEDTTPENGCLQVIPKSHLWGMQKWGHIARDLGEAMSDRADLDISGLIEAPMKAGSALMFHSLTVHGSGPNNSPHPRHTALYAYFPPSVRYCPRKGQPVEKTFPVIAGVGGKSEERFVAGAVEGDGQ